MKCYFKVHKDNMNQPISTDNVITIPSYYAALAQI